MIIRHVIKEDIPYIIEGELKAFNHTLGDALYYEFDKPYSLYLACIDDDKLVGYISTRYFIPQAEILNFYIDDDKRGKKYGLNLIQFALDYLKNIGVNSVSLEVRKSNQAAINLYNKVGFITKHVRINYYDNGEDALLMIKEM